MKVGLLLVCLLLTSYHAHAEEYLVHQFSQSVRIVLSNTPCPNGMKGKRAAAQRIDKQFIRGCWAQDPANKANVKINWEIGDFTVIPVSEFYPVKVEENTKPEL